MYRTSRRRFIVAASAPAVLALAVGGFLFVHGAKANNTIAMVAQDATANNAIAVNVNAADVLGTVPSIADGLNTATFDGHLNDSATTTAIAGAGIEALRYPGGSTADAYRWQTNTTVNGLGYANPSNGFDDFMGIAQKTGASPIITVNYGSGTAAEAAAWVQYANVTKKYGVKYWELGNEIPGDGTYGAQWEYNTKPKGATAYADNIADYITQMKAADPGIKVGAVLTTYNSWPDGLVASKYGDTADWNTTVLKKDGPKLDFVIVHYYPTSKSESELLTQYQNIATLVKQTRAEINQYAGSNAANIQIMITETDSSFEFDSVPAALYGVDSYLTFLQNGVDNIDWWDLHNGPGSTSTTLADGSTEYGDGGVLSSGGCTGSGACEPAANTPFPAYYGLQAVSRFAPAGAQMIGVTSSNATVSAYAVKTSSGMNVVLVNHDPHSSEPVSIGYAGFNPASVTSAEQFSDANPKLSALSGADARSLTLPAYSITVLHLSGSDSGSSSASGSSPSSGSGSSSSSSSGSGSSTGSVDTASCTVTSSTVPWPGGYTQSVRITNTGSAAVSGWKVTFALPARERVVASWNVTRSQSGRNVVARPVSYDKTIAAGGTLPFGFNASDSGTAATPTWYALNGVRCKSVA